jgi:hypothetical protein
MMGDLKRKWLILAKGWLFLVVGLLASSMLILRHPELATLALLVIAIWAFCRFYYFAFYVIEHYVDGEFRYSGLHDFLRYFTTRRN